MKEMGAMAEVPSFRVTSASVTSAAWAADVTRNEGNSAIAPISFISRGMSAGFALVVVAGQI